MGGLNKKNGIFVNLSCILMLNVRNVIYFLSLSCVYKVSCFLFQKTCEHLLKKFLVLHIFGANHMKFL